MTRLLVLAFKHHFPGFGFGAWAGRQQAHGPGICGARAAVLGASDATSVGEVSESHDLYEYRSVEFIGVVVG
jgi:hypothetical protein